MFESQSLALVDGDRPSGFQRILAEGAGNGFGDFLCFGIDRIFYIVPGFLFDDDLVSFTVDYGYLVGINKYDLSDLPVIVPFFGRRVVFDEHDLRAAFQDQLVVGRVRIFGEVVVDLGREGVRLAGKLRQFPVVDLLCLVVMRRERDIARLFVRSEVGNVPLIQLLQGLVVEAVLTDIVQ